MRIITKNVHGYDIKTVDDSEDPIKVLKNASVESQVSSWARLHKLENNESAIKNASTKHELSSWARLHRLGSIN
ncbi:MAG TPA: hypothetical protein VJ772_06465 [Nitrososphaeraceae archaeon]|nr:hypothetical protein [Nitrososphaeraceae archaeon]